MKTARPFDSVSEIEQTLFFGSKQKKTLQWNLEDSVLLSKKIRFKVLKDQQFDLYFVRQIENKCVVWKKGERDA